MADNMSRREFTNKTKLAAFNLSKGICSVCEMKIVGRPEYDHELPDGLGGSNDLDNCAVVCTKCHSSKTHTEDRPMMAKADRLRKKHLGIIRPKGLIKSRGFRKD